MKPAVSKSAKAPRVAKAPAPAKRAAKPPRPRKAEPVPARPAIDTEPLGGETADEGDLSRGEESPAGSGWSNMGGGGDEHIGRPDVGGSSWDEDWEDAEEYGEGESDLYGERAEPSDEE